MTPAEFAQSLYQVIAIENLETYRDLFTENSVEKVSDPYWKRALTLFSSLPLEHKEMFFDVIRQISVDTASNVLGIVDGVASLDAGTPSFELTAGGVRLEGDLQSLFLVEAEKHHAI